MSDRTRVVRAKGIHEAQSSVVMITRLRLFVHQSVCRVHGYNMWLKVIYPCLLVVGLTFSVTMAEEGAAPTVALNDGNVIPIFGLGTYGSSKDIAKMREVVVLAVEAGYRLIDTAALYRNEEQIGLGIADAIAKGLIKREELFITTKLWNDKHGRNDVVPALRESLKKLGLDYVDLYLIHSPESEKADGSPANIDILETWQGMEEAKELGLAKSIGVSNFNIEQIDKIIAKGNVKPAMNQIEVHPSNTQEQLVANCQARGVTVTAYSPFGFLVRNKPDAPAPKVDDPVLVDIAKKYKKSPTQVVLRYLIDRYLIPIPKTTNKDRLKHNIDIFDFRLTEEDIVTINKFNSNSTVF